MLERLQRAMLPRLFDGLKVHYVVPEHDPVNPTVVVEVTNHRLELEPDTDLVALGARGVAAPQIRRQDRQRLPRSEPSEGLWRRRLTRPGNPGRMSDPAEAGFERRKSSEVECVLRLGSPREAQQRVQKRLGQRCPTLASKCAHGPDRTR